MLYHLCAHGNVLCSLKCWHDAQRPGSSHSDAEQILLSTGVAGIPIGANCSRFWQTYWFRHGLKADDWYAYTYQFICFVTLVQQYLCPASCLSRLGCI